MINKIIAGIMAGIVLIVISLISTMVFAQSNQTSPLQSQQQTSVCKLTESDLLGPYYKEGAPFKPRLAEGIEGERLIITGKVLDTRCNPAKGAILDIWQANSTGQYDNIDFSLRGKVKADNDGKYLIDTIVPRYYSAGDITRPGHVHLKVGIPGQPVLTTQLYFEGDPYITELEDKSLVMKINEENATKRANFDFVIEHYPEYDAK